MDSDLRAVLVDDAIQWLKQYNSEEGASLVASLPDISEFPHFSLDQWKAWFVDVATLILSKTPELGVTVFYQSDIKLNGEWVDKGYLCQKAAENLGHKLLWHKVICRAPAGMATFGRPAYSHILCFSKMLHLSTEKSTADVIPSMGDKTWQRGMGVEGALMIAKFIKELTSSHTLINPFCGEGSMLAAANAYGLKAVGIEKGVKRAERARHIQINLAEKKFYFPS